MSSHGPGTSPAFVVIESLQGAPGATPDEFGSPLASDVRTNGGVFNDLGQAQVSLALKNPGVVGSPTAPSQLNTITLNRYRVTYRRADGRNTPGVDVPHPFDAAATVTVPTTGSITFGFEVVRVQAKLEPPLANLAGVAGGRIVISTLAEITFYGRDQAGNEVEVTGTLAVNFSDFADPECRRIGRVEAGVERIMRSLGTRIIALLAVALGTASCTVKETEAPSLSGPSELALSLNVQANPDTILQDGAAQSVITVDARGPNGQPVRNLSMRVDMRVGDVFADFGTLSTRTVVTGDDGMARFTYTAPPRARGYRPRDDRHAHGDADRLGLPRLDSAGSGHPRDPARDDSAAQRRAAAGVHVLAVGADDLPGNLLRRLGHSGRGRRVRHAVQLHLVVRRRRLGERHDRDPRIPRGGQLQRDPARDRRSRHQRAGLAGLGRRSGHAADRGVRVLADGAALRPADLLHAPSLLPPARAGTSCPTTGTSAAAAPATASRSRSRYHTPGTYNVTLTVTDDASQKNTYVEDVTVSP